MMIARVLDRTTSLIVRVATTYMMLCVVLVAVASAAEPPITGVAFAPDGNAVVAVSQAGLQVYRWPDLDVQRTVETTASNLHCVSFSPNGKQVAVGGGDPAEDGNVAIYSWPQLKLISTHAGHADSVTSIAWLDDATFVSASNDREVKLWKTEDADDKATTFSGHSGGVNAVCVLRDRQTLVTAGIDQSVRVWDVPSTKLRRSLSQHTRPIHTLALRPTEEGLPMVASASADRTIRFWQPTIGRMVRYIRLDAEPLDITWLQDGTHLAAACVDGRVRVVNAETVTVVQNLPAIESWAYTIAVHPTAKSVVVGGGGGQLKRVTIAIPKKLDEN